MYIIATWNSNWMSNSKFRSKIECVDTFWILNYFFSELLFLIAPDLLWTLYCVPLPSSLGNVLQEDPASPSSFFGCWRSSSSSGVPPILFQDVASLLSDSVPGSRVSFSVISVIFAMKSFVIIDLSLFSTEYERYYDVSGQRSEPSNWGRMSNRSSRAVDWEASGRQRWSLHVESCNLIQKFVLPLLRVSSRSCPWKLTIASSRSIIEWDYAYQRQRVLTSVSSCLCMFIRLPERTLHSTYTWNWVDASGPDQK